jgi:hypothetical protein
VIAAIDPRRVDEARKQIPSLDHDRAFLPPRR